MVVVIIICLFFVYLIYLKMKDYKNPDIENWKSGNMVNEPKWRSKSDEELKKLAKRDDIIFIFEFVFFIVLTLTIYTVIIKNSSTTTSTVEEQQLNDLGYYKEDGKWNYEGGDAGQNDGKAGD